MTQPSCRGSSLGDTRQQCSQWKSPTWKSPTSSQLKKARKVISGTKSIIFFDIRGFVRCKFVPRGQTVNSKIYCNVLRLLRKGTFSRNSLNCCTRAIGCFMMKMHLSPDLAPCDFLFLKMKEGRKEMFYLTMHSTHFIYGYMASDIW